MAVWTCDKAETEWVRSMDLKVKGVRDRGRLKLTWTDMVRKNAKRLGLSKGDIQNRRDGQRK